MMLKNKKALISVIILLCLWSPQTALLSAKAHFSKTSDFTTSKLLKITIIDVWQGDSIFIQLPNGKNALIDAGEGKTEYSMFDAPTVDIFPFMKRNHIGTNDIQYFVATHPHHDHIGGIVELLHYFHFSTIYDSGMPYTTDNYLDFLKTVDKLHIQYIIPKTGDTLNWDKDVQISVLHSGEQHYQNPNNNSIVLRIQYKKFAIILEGDAEREAEEDMLNTGLTLKATVLKSAHHGSDTSSTDDFLDALNPQVIVISVGKYNKFGHPVQSTIEKYMERGYKIYRTDYNGDITITTDGLKYTITTEK